MQKECVDGWSKESSRTGFCPIDVEEAARLAIHVIRVFCGMRLWREDGESKGKRMGRASQLISALGMESGHPNGCESCTTIVGEGR